MTYLIHSNIEVDWGFLIVALLVFIPYYFKIKSFLNAWLSNSFPGLCILIVGLGYLNIHYWYNCLSIAAAHFSLYCNIFNHKVVASIIFKYICIKVWSLPYIIILYGPIRSTNNLSQGMVFTSFADKWPYCCCCFLTSFSNFSVGPNFVSYINSIVILNNIGISTIRSWEQ